MSLIPKYLRRQEIDTVKWNECILRAPNGFCYADAAYLDAMAANWDALVLNDYEAVMPLPWKRKYGIRYLYQPFFCQQLGIVQVDAGADLSSVFLENIPSTFLYWDIHLNAHNRISSFPVSLRKNYLLPLSSDYKTLQGNYDRNARRNIKRGSEAGITVREGISFQTVLDLHHQRFGQGAGLTGFYRSALQPLLQEWSEAGRALAVGVFDRKGKIIASSAYILYKNRITFLINGNAEESLKNGATHVLKDHIIRKFAGNGMTLDFEGSENPRFARFYEQFGGKAMEHYPRLVLNRLPWPLNLFKRAGSPA